MTQRLFQTVFSLPLLMAVVSISLTQSAQAQNFEASGDVVFSNLQGFMDNLEEVPYFGMGQSNVTGMTLQKGSIRPMSPPEVVNDGVMGGRFKFHQDEKMEFFGTLSHEVIPDSWDLSSTRHP